MRLYCPVCKEETNHPAKNEDFAICQTCNTSIWIDEYPILDTEVASNFLIEARQRYQIEKHAYYKALGIKKRLEYLRSQIQAECISYGEIAELQALAQYIEPGGVELLQWAGVPEHTGE